MSAVVQANGAQVLPPAGDPHQTISAYHAMCAADADLRARVPFWAEIAARLSVVPGKV